MRIIFWKKQTDAEKEAAVLKKEAKTRKKVAKQAEKARRKEAGAVRARELEATADREMNDRMVVEIVSNKVWGGGERYALDLAETLRRDGAIVEVVSRGYSAAEGPFRKKHFPIIRARLGGLLDFGSARKIARLINDSGGAELTGITLHAHNFKDAITAVRVKRRLGEKARVVVTRHLVKKGKAGWGMKKILREIDSIVFVSKTAADAYFSGFGERSDLGSALRGKAEVVSNAVGQDYSKVKRKEPLEGEPLRLTFMGRLNPEKGPELMIDALAKIPELDWTLTVAGTGDKGYVESLKQRAKAAGIADKVKWAGYTDKTADLVGKTDIGLFPSLAAESFGLAILEFMKGGVPVVATDTGAQKELVEHGVNGLLCAPEADPLARAIETMLTDQELRKKASAAALATAEEHSYPQFYRKMRKILLPMEIK